MPLVPWHHIEIGLWGPLNVDDRNGFSYTLGAIDRATGKFFLQPIRAKSDALAAMKHLFALIRAQAAAVGTYCGSLIHAIYELNATCRT